MILLKLKLIGFFRKHGAVNSDSALSLEEIKKKFGFDYDILLKSGLVAKTSTGKIYLDIDSSQVYKRTLWLLTQIGIVILTFLILIILAIFG